MQSTPSLRLREASLGHRRSVFASLGMMAQNMRRHGRKAEIDGFAMALSGLCALHCLISSVVVVMLASAGGILLDPIIHEIGLGFAIVLAGFAFVDGFFRHGFIMPLALGSLGLGVMLGALELPHNGSEIVATLLGIALLALGHDLNRRARRSSFRFTS